MRMLLKTGISKERVLMDAAAAAIYCGHSGSFAHRSRRHPDAHASQSSRRKAEGGIPGSGSGL